MSADPSASPNKEKQKRHLQQQRCGINENPGNSQKKPLD